LLARTIIYERISAQYALVITPTRELSVQVQSMMCKLAQFTNLHVALVTGGLDSTLRTNCIKLVPEVIVATPGRVVDLKHKLCSITLKQLTSLVLDEADKLLEMGFIHKIKEIITMCSMKRQTILLSATMTKDVQKLTCFSLKEPVRLVADTKFLMPANLKQEIIRLKGLHSHASKVAVLLALCARKTKDCRTIIFFRTKRRAHRMKILFGLTSLSLAVELHGDMTQTHRLESIDMFRRGKASFLLSTDLASRGLDIPKVHLVVNFDVPSKFKTYIHRVGRTARKEKTGRSITIIEDRARDRALLKQIVKQQKLTNIQSCIIPTAQIISCMTTLYSVRSDFLDTIIREE
jgi:ATP-dependent RNA helicase DDX27